MPESKKEIAASLPAVEGPGTDDDAQLVERALEGERWAWEALFRRHVTELTERVTRLLGRADEADDAVQQAFVNAINKLDRLKRPEAFRAWLNQIAVNLAHKRLRRRRLERLVGLERYDNDATLERLASAEVSAEQRADLRVLDQALGRLPAAERIAWMFRHVEGDSLPVIAEACGCSLATVKRRIARAEKKLRARMRIGGEK